MNQRKLGTLLSYLHIVVSNVISILYTPYMLQMMGTSEYGLYGTAGAFVSYLSVMSFGIGGAYIRFNARCRAQGDIEGEKQLNGMFLAVFSILSLAVMLGGIVLIAFAEVLVEESFTPAEMGKLRVIMALMTANMIVTFLFNVVQMALMAYEQFVCIRVVLLLAAMAQPILNILALQSGGRAIAITAISFSVGLVCYVFFFLYARRKIHLRFSFRGFQWSDFRELFAFSLFLFINSITDQITFSTDNVVLSATSGTAAVAVYTVGANFKGYFQSFSTSISSVFAAQVNQIVAQDRDIRELDDLFIRIGRIQFYVVSLIVIGFAAIGREFIYLWAGSEYGDAYWIGLLLILAVFVPSFQNIGLQIQQALNKHKARSIVYFIIALGNIVLTIFFVKWWGGIGAALATTLCMFLGTVVFMNWYYYRHIGLNIHRFWCEIGGMVPGFVPSVLVGWAIHHWCTLNSFWDILLAAGAISAVFLLFAWKFSMNDYERNLLRNPVHKLWRKIRGNHHE